MIAAMTVLAAVLAGCGGSSDSGAEGADSGDTTPTAPPAASAPASTTAAGTVESGPLDIATTPGWEPIVEPILSALNGVGDGSPTFRLDVPWMETNAAEDVEQRILSAVASGELDAGYVGVRALSALDVPGFDVLLAPGLIDSYELQEAVIASDLPDRLLPRLGDLGVTGLALVPGPMRYPIGVAEPFVGPGDFAGVSFHTFAAEINASTVEALGAIHSQLWGGARDDAIDAGIIDVTENSLMWMRDNGRGSHVTLGALWPATGVFVVNAEVLAGLPAGRVEAMTSAIATASSRAADLVAAESSLAAELCAAGKRVVAPSAEDRTAMVAALQPVYEAIAADATAGPMLVEIQHMKSALKATVPAVPADCVAAPAVSAAGSDDPSVLNGAYEFEWTVDELMSELDADEGTARGNAGPFVLTFDDGTFNMVWQDIPDDPCGGTYAVSGNRVQLVAATDVATWTCGGESLGDLVVDAMWTLDGDQLVLSDFVLSPQPDITWWNAGYFSKPLTRVSG
jgi:TRAP-type C4-dicarboxylate transport system substrate-binding protein